MTIRSQCSDDEHESAIDRWQLWLSRRAAVHLLGLVLVLGTALYVVVGELVSREHRLTIEQDARVYTVLTGRPDRNGFGEGNGSRRAVYRVELTERNQLLIPLLRDLPELRWLECRGMTLDGNALQQIAALRELRFLDLGGSALSFPMEMDVGSLGNLEAVFLSETDLDDDGLRIIGRAAGLRVINLRGTRISSEGLRHLADLVHLESLSISRTQIDGNGLKTLAVLPKLRYLDVRDTRISDGDISILLHCAALEWLDLRGSAVSQSGSSSLQSLHSTLRVRWEPK